MRYCTGTVKWHRLVVMNLEERLVLHLGKSPILHPTTYLAASAVVIGDVSLGAHSSVWPLCVLRGDINSIRIGTGSNLQDGTIVHLADDYGVEVGDYVTVGHGAVLHACRIEDECLIGMRATILDGAVIGRRSIVGAGALVPKGMVVPPGSMVLGLPARVVRPLREEEQAELRYWAEKYVVTAAFHKQRQAAQTVV